MRKLLFIIVLFFSTSVLAQEIESYNCEMTIKAIGFSSNENYNLEIFIGNTKNSTIAEIDPQGKIVNQFSELATVANIFFGSGHPYGLIANFNTDIYFTKIYENKKTGFFFRYLGNPSIIEMVKRDNVWDIFISDTATSYEKTQVGVCR